MPFNLSLGDITKIKCDAVVNSIGVDASVYGKLCTNIVKKANSQELVQRLSVEKNGKIGSMFLTPGYELKATNIIHVVSPFKKDDNDNCDNLKKIYDDVIQYAINKNFKTITLPFLASGANGYSDEEVYKAAMESIGGILDKEDEMHKEIIDITLVAYLKPKNNKAFKEEEYTTRFSNVFEDSLFTKIHNFAMMSNMMKKEEALVPSYSYNYPFDYIDDYVAQKRNGHYKELNQAGYDHRRRARLKTYIDIPRDDIYALIFVLNMNITEALQFMTLCGISMSPCRKIDVFFRDYLFGKYGKVNHLWDLNDLAYDANMEDKYTFLKGKSAYENM